MRKLMVGLIAVGLLAVAAPAMAQTADPLGVISSGTVLPYVGDGTIAAGSASYLEVYSPTSANPKFHMFFYSSACVRGPESVGLPLTTNDVEILRVDNIGQNPREGLITAAAVDDAGFSLLPLSVLAPIQARVLWVNNAQDFERVLEPISITNFEAISLNATWNPLRTGATFYAPPEVGGFHTTIYLVCPNQNITWDVQLSGGNPAFLATGNGPFPALNPLPHSGTGDVVPMRGRIYDDEENFKRDITFTCGCLTSKRVTDLSSIYADITVTGAPNGTYTEIESDFSFTGYRAMQAGGLDAFGRLSSGSKQLIQGNIFGGILQR